MEMELQ